MSLAVTYLKLTSFRSYRAAEIAVGSEPVIIFGPNGAGKTNLLEAVSLLSPGRGMRRSVAADLPRHGSDGWSMRAEICAEGRLHEIETQPAPGGGRKVRIDGKTVPQHALGRHARLLWLVPSMDRIWIEGAEGRRRFLDRMTLSLRPDHAETSMIYDRALRERNRLLREGSQDVPWFLALERQMAKAGAQISANRSEALGRIVAAQRDASTTFPAADLSVLPPKDYGKYADAVDADQLREALAASRSAEFRAGRSLVGPHRVDLRANYRAKKAPAAQCSTGEQKALLISLVLSNARALGRHLSAPPILLLDEIAAHLDAERRAALFAEIRALGAQAWMTGTGPELFDAMEPPATRFRIEEGPEGSEIRPG